MATVNVKRTFDDEKIKKILTDPELWERIAPKHVSINDFLPPMSDDFHYLEVLSGGDTAGLFILHPEGKNLKIHANILKKFRKTAARDSGIQAIQYFLGTDYENLVASIPEKFPDVYHYTKKFGFDDVLVNGKHEMILTRSKANELYEPSADQSEQDFLTSHERES